MGTSGTDAAAFSGKEEEEDEYYEFEHLPPLLEDEENVSLADILSLRDSCLTEPEVWAVCVECIVALKSIAALTLFHTLCVTPDTLAFNAHGNVCFMEQLSDDPEGSFIPPEFDKTGSTIEGHIFSLGSTLSAALNFVIEPELEAELGEDIQGLLVQMQEENPEDRPLPQEILSLAEDRLVHVSSTALCRKLSSIGRRVLSVESITTFQDGWTGSWEANWQKSKPNWQLHKCISSEDSSSKDQGIVSDAMAGIPEPNNSSGQLRHHVCLAWDSSLLVDSMGDEVEDGRVNHRDLFGSLLDSRSQNNSPVFRRTQEMARGVLNRSCSAPESSNPPAFPPHGDISGNVSDLTVIGTNEGEESGAVWSKRGGGEKDPEPWDPVGGGGGERHSDGRCSTRDDPSPSQLAQNAEALADSACVSTSISNLYAPNNHMTKSMLCLNEESQDEWISLRDLLTRNGRRLCVNELWALCYTCLSTLQTYIDYPAYLCLDTMYVGCGGEVLFLNPRNAGSCDAFYLAPEFQEHGIVTEKACVYGVAAVLWATAKFNLSANQKLAMPRKLKRLLLEMAKRTPIERPSIIMAKKCCRDYLSRQATNAETVWTKLIYRVHPPIIKAIRTEDQNGLDRRRCSNEQSTHIKSGFLPMATESRLAPVPGPVPHSCSINRASHLPEAFTSPATHFTPIVLTKELDADVETPLPALDVEGNFRKTPRGSNIQPVQDANNQETPQNFLDSPLSFKYRNLQEYRRHTPGNLSSMVSRNVSPSSSGRTLVNSTPPDLPGLTSPQTPVPDHSLPPPTSHFPLSSCCQSSHQTGGHIFNDFLLRQDPQTGHLILMPVHITAPVSSHKLALNAPLTTNFLRDQTGGPLDQLTPGQGEDPLLDCCNGGPSDSTAHISHSYNGVGHRSTGECEDEPTSRSTGPPLGDSHPQCAPRINDPLQEVICLLRAEFAFDGYLENDVEDLLMGEYILSLKDLQFQTFCNVIKEKFCDLYWKKELLRMLHCVVNHSQIPLGSSKPSPSKPRQRAATAPLSAPGWKGEVRDTPQRGGVDLNGHLHHVDTVVLSKTFKTDQKALSAQGQAEGKPASRDIQSEEGQYQHQGLRKAECLGKGGMESDEHPVGGVDESPSDAYLRWGVDEPLRVACLGQMSPDFTEEMEETDCLVSDRLLSPSSGADEYSQSFSLAWALAFYGEDCFSQDVVEYAMNLGHHCESPCLELKAQELQQHIAIEMKNLKKTRNFYQKLFHQEMKNKGSETRLMLSKIKVQLEELRSKVEFLVFVKKYLEVLSVDQWGVDVSLIPSLAASGPGTPLDLQPSEEPAVLGLVSMSWVGRGKRSLQAATPLGLMSYLYARNAALEGFIQQFLYTYRYFCTPQDLLKFLMDKLSSAAAGVDVSRDSVKVYHRSLDVLQTWLTDCRLVDFCPKSNLLRTLEIFLTTEVSPGDIRGERLLATLHSSPRRRWSQGYGWPISMLDDKDALPIQTLGRKSSIEDSGRKWKISRIVEAKSTQPKDTAYSIAAALPHPCYASFLDDPSTDCLRGEERHHFSHSGHSTQHAARQLTLLQQELFQGCHPVHFLNSRAQGVRDSAVNVTKQVSHSLPPAEGSSLFFNDGVSSGGYLQQLLRYEDSVSNWVSAEIVTCDSIKTQAALLTKFLLIGKHCYEWRDFATAMQILGGLENVIVRQLPVWKHLSTKVCEVREELRAVQVFLKSDNLCLMGGERVKRRPTLPFAHILAIHIQQLELGSFTLTSGAYKWPKLRTIARVVSQVEAFQGAVFPFPPDLELQAYLRLRMAQLGDRDVPSMAAENEANFHHTPADRHARRLQDTLRRMKASFQ